jgi:outer membrane protein
MRRVLLALGLVLVGILGGFGEVQAEESLPLTLEECVGAALEVHPELRLAAQHVSEMEQKLLQADSLGGPRLDIGASWTRYGWLPPNKARIIGGGKTDIYSELALRQSLYSGGRNRALSEQARLDLLEAYEELRRARQSVVLRVREAFFLLRRAQGFLLARREAVGQVEAWLEVARRREAIGTARKLDVMKAEVQLADVRQEAIAAENRVEVGRLALNLAMGRPSETPLQIAAVMGVDGPSEGAVESSAEDLKSHPDWIRSELAIQRAEAGLTVARSLGSPELDIQAGYNLEGGAFPPETNNWNVGLLARIPIWDSGNAAGAAGAASARIAQARSAQERTGQRLDFSVREARLAVHDATERLQVLRFSVEEARRAMAVEQERYRVGVGSSLEVIDAQVALTRAETNVIGAICDQKIARARLDYALGRDFVPAEEQAISPHTAGGGQ